MTGVGWFMTIILGGLAGWLASKIMKASTGLLSNIVVGVLGAVVLNAIIGAFGLIPPDGWLAQSVIAIIGACLLIWLYRLVRGRA
jgi:uncharacterized membrane protein YeaQ/YmgE (transglycosylase-associated protein family)